MPKLLSTLDNADNIGTGSVNWFVTSADLTKLDSIQSGAEVNQNAFTSVAVSGQTTVSADDKQDTLTLVAGTNVTITTDAATDSITINATYIVASGNASGQYWIQYSDGTLIKWGTLVQTSAVSVSFGNIFISPSTPWTITFNTTVAFSSTPSITGQTIDATGNSRTSWFLPNGISSTAINYQIGRATSTTSQNWNVHWQAIGRWD